MATYKRRMITDKDKLDLGDCTCVIRNKYTGQERTAFGSVARVPYNKYATKETKQKYGKNLVYVIHRNNEEVVGYFQDRKNSKLSRDEVNETIFNNRPYKLDIKVKPLKKKF